MWLRFALIASLLTPTLHIIVLLQSGQDGLTSPISVLSQQPLGVVHTVALVLFGTAHLAVAIALGSLDRGRLWPYGRWLLVAGGAALFYTAYYFATLSPELLRGPQANDPLWMVATLTGCAMGALQPGLARQIRPLGLFNAACLAIWLALIPTILFVTDGWIGAYERIVGSVYVIWMLGVTLGLMTVTGTRKQAGR